MKHFRNALEAMGFLQRRKGAYQIFVNSPGGTEVLADLAQFCRATESTYASDPYLHARLEGRRDVWLRIQQHLHLQPTDLFQLVTGKPFIRPTQPEDLDP